MRIHLLGLAIYTDGLVIVALEIKCGGNIRVYYQRKRRELLCASHFQKGLVWLPGRLIAVSVQIVGAPIIRIELDGSLQLSLRTWPVPFIQQF
ncbi:MAG: hypothetical protein DMF74_25305 [Acidobacteria bacterium]|nr:MAG: hypothetical protein DMF74_25305 [Acidobacteriota bacterium]